MKKPLYVEATWEGDREILQRELAPDVLRLDCAECKEATNWKRDDAAYDSARLTRVLWTYECVQCAGFAETVTYWLKLCFYPVTSRGVSVVSVHSSEMLGTHVKIKKLGQSEPWNVRPNRDVEKELTEEDRRLYRRALLNMSSGYGLGALTYFRRVIENETGRLLEVVRDLAASNGDEDLVAKLNDARTSFNADQRLMLAANATPQSLKHGGVNPLRVLYELTSEGVHGKTEEECIEIAEDIRATFEFVFRHVRNELEQRKEMARVLTRRRNGKQAQRPATPPKGPSEPNGSGS